MRLGVLAAIFGCCFGIAQAQSGPVVVELFTSQGCASCPPADALLRDLTAHDDVLPLSLHVDYWDYIGWPDEFASSAFTHRQRSYAHATGRTMIYTPQMIIDGQSEVAGFKPVKVMELIDAHRARPDRVSLQVVRNGESIRIKMAPLDASLPRPLEIVLVRYLPHAHVEIRAGENAGRSVDYTNIVRDWRAVAEWDGASAAVIETEWQGDLPGAVLLQEAGPGAVLAAARLR